MRAAGQLRATAARSAGVKHLQRMRGRGFLIALVAACSSHGPDVIFLPSAPDVVARMLAIAQVDSTDIVYDLGCGDGRVVIAAARDRGARGVCVDINPALIASSRRNADTAGIRERIEFRHADLFEVDLSTATVVALYLSPALNQRLRPKLYREVRPGTRIVSHNFDMGDWRPDSVARVEWPTGTTSSVYAWVRPADVAGNWELTVAEPGGDRRYQLRFTQHYQEVSGTVSSNGRPVDLSVTRLHGDSLEFRLTDEQRGVATADLRFRGRLSAFRMAGVVHGAGLSAMSWQATRR
jgi:SAM-dependent methyltransferase